MIAYRLHGRYDRLVTRVGLDDRTPPGSSARITILGDRRPLFEAGDIGGRSEPLTCVVDVSGVDELILLSQEAGSPSGNGSGQSPPAIDWLDPRLFR
jgi:hypothetical protein